VDSGRTVGFVEVYFVFPVLLPWVSFGNHIKIMTWTQYGPSELWKFALHLLGTYLLIIGFRSVYGTGMRRIGFFNADLMALSAFSLPVGCIVYVTW